VQRDDMGKRKKLPPELQAWIEARKRFHLSHTQVQMARELGMNPKKLGGMANHRHEPWKVPLPQYIEELYFERFRKKRPDNVRAGEREEGKAARTWRGILDRAGRPTYCGQKHA